MADTRGDGRRRFPAAVLRAPITHFIVLGGLLFAAESWWHGRSAAQVDGAALEPLVITSAEVSQIRRDFVVQNKFPPSPEQLGAEVEAAIDEEILYREALATGLAHDNESIRRRLVQLARFVSDEPDQDEDALYQTALDLGLDRSDLVVRRQLSMLMRLVVARTPMADETPPDDAELEAFLRDNPDRFMRPWRAKLAHVFLNSDRRGAERRARKVLDKLRSSGLGARDVSEFGDPFLLGQHLPWRSRLELARMFGSPFADSVVALEPGGWSEPIESGYGWHLVWLEAVEPDRVPDLAEVRDEVHAAVLSARRQWRVEETLKAMRAAYRIEVDWPQGDAVSNIGVKADG